MENRPEFEELQEKLQPVMEEVSRSMARLGSSLREAGEVFAAEMHTLADQLKAIREGQTRDNR